MKNNLLMFFLFLTVLVVINLDASAATQSSISVENSASVTQIGALLPLWSVIPFIGVLLSIALFPLFASNFWHNHFPKISAFWALLFAVPFLFVFKGNGLYEIVHIYIIDYIPFIILLWALFTISGNIYIRGSAKETPAVNSILLLTGAVLASIIGTTGASMLLIRTVLRTNKLRKYKVHTIVFFIFLVGNIGGSLTPIGDPPLFLGFIHGVPFLWTMKLLPITAFTVFILITIYYLMDKYYYSKEDAASLLENDSESIKIEGGHNFIFLIGVIGAVVFSGIVKLGEVNIFGIHQTVENLIKDAFLILMGILALATTEKKVRIDNSFDWIPIREVAILFAGIFMTIIPALAMLKAGEHGAFASLVKSMESPAHYFWVSGSLSSFLDNAPTYLTFFSSLLGKFYPGMQEAEAVAKLIAERAPYLMAISAGSVFMGAVTYIGNAPNFMIKSISEEFGVDMPSFFGYMFKYSIPVLVPLFIVITLVFF